MHVQKQCLLTGKGFRINNANKFTEMCFAYQNFEQVEAESKTCKFEVSPFLFMRDKTNGTFKETH